MFLGCTAYVPTCVRAQSGLTVTPRTVTRQAPLSKPRRAAVLLRCTWVCDLLVCGLYVLLSTSFLIDFFFTLNSAFIVDITVWGYFLLAVYSRVSFFHLLGSHRLQLGELNPFICTVMTPVFGFVSHFSFVIHSSVLYSLCFYPAWTSIQSFLPLHHYSNLECWSYFSIHQFTIYPPKHWQCLNIK